MLFVRRTTCASLLGEIVCELIVVMIGGSGFWAVDSEILVEFIQHLHAFLSYLIFCH